MLNYTNDNSETIFVDLDGTLVIHNYDPERQADVVIQSTVDFILEHPGAYLVLTTSRSNKHIDNALGLLGKHGIKFERVISGLPTGKRYLINDSKTPEKKAIAVNLVRNLGYAI